MNIQKTTTLIKKDADARGNEGHFVGLADGMSNACVMSSDAEAQKLRCACASAPPKGAAMIDLIINAAVIGALAYLLTSSRTGR